MVPDGRNTAASLPKSVAMRSQSSWIAGSSPCCSSPTSAAIIAAFMPGDGLVWVSEYRLTRKGGSAGSVRAGAYSGAWTIRGLRSGGRWFRRTVNRDGPFVEGRDHAAHGLVEHQTD